MALVGGFFGGISGVWGPPVVMYLLALDLPKQDMVRAQSLSFLLGSVVLLAAHLHSGVLNAVTLPVSVWLTVPTMIGMFIGYRVHDRLDQDRFRRATLAVLAVPIGVKFSEMCEAVRMAGSRSEELKVVVDLPVAVAIEGKEAIIRLHPTRAFGETVHVQVELGYGVGKRDELYAVVIKINDQWRNGRC